MTGKSGSRTTITVPEISERLGICEDTIYEMLRSKAIPNIRRGRRYIVSRAAFEHWEQTIGEDSQGACKVA
jgi:excisionase family DNA binding protein